MDVYMVRAGADGGDEDYALEHGVAILGFHEVPTLEGMSDREEVRSAVSGAYPDSSPRSAGNVTSQLWQFVTMRDGDLVVLPRKRTAQVAIGRVTGPYEHRTVGGVRRHVRPVAWDQTDLPRTIFRQDLLFSLGAMQTVCSIWRNDAVRRIAAMLKGSPDPGPSLLPEAADDKPALEDLEWDLPQLAHVQIEKHIQTVFKGHALADLVDAILRADGWMTEKSPRARTAAWTSRRGAGILGLTNHGSVYR